MSFKTIQQQVDEGVQQYKIPYWKPHEILARLVEESGELAREINHQYGPKPKKAEEKANDVGEELADIVFTVCCYANSQGINLDDAWKKVMDKGYGRDGRRYERKWTRN